MPASAADKRDFFISHASEDKEEVAIPLAARLEERGFKVWLDQERLSAGDPLAASLDRALLNVRHAIVIVSPAYLDKYWTGEERGAIQELNRSRGGYMVPVRHGLSQEQLVERAPTIAGRISLSTDAGLDALAADISRVAGSDAGPGRRPSPPARRWTVVAVAAALGVAASIWLAVRPRGPAAVVVAVDDFTVASMGPNEESATAEGPRPGLAGCDAGHTYCLSIAGLGTLPLPRNGLVLGAHGASGASGAATLPRVRVQNARIALLRIDRSQVPPVFRECIAQLPCAPDSGVIRCVVQNAPCLPR